jgi:hypothetical protein
MRLSAPCNNCLAADLMGERLVLHAGHRAQGTWYLALLVAIFDILLSTVAANWARL